MKTQVHANYIFKAVSSTLFSSYSWIQIVSPTPSIFHSDKNTSAQTLQERKEQGIQGMKIEIQPYGHLQPKLSDNTIKNHCKMLIWNYNDAFSKGSFDTVYFREDFL